MQVFHVGMEERVQRPTTTTHAFVQMDSLGQPVNKVQWNLDYMGASAP